MGKATQTSDQFKEALIDDYLEQNPGLHRSQVVLRFKNGKPVFDTIDKVMSSASVSMSKENQQELLRKEMEVSDDERYQACSESITNCKQLVDFFFTAAFVAFSLAEKKETLNTLKRCERVILDRTHTKFNIKKEFLEMMSGGGKISRSRIRSIIVLYFRALLDQLKSQNDVYSREYDLGNRLGDFAKGFIKEKATAIQSEVKPKTMERIAGIYTAAKRVTGEKVPKPAKITVGELEKALAEMDVSLEKRRVLMHDIQKVIEFMEEVLKRIEQQGDSSISQEETNPKKKTRRMAFMSKIFGRN